MRPPPLRRLQKRLRSLRFNTRACSHWHGIDNHCEVDETAEHKVKLVVTGKHSPKALEPQKNRSILFRFLYNSLSYVQGALRFAFGGTTGIYPSSTPLALVQLPSYALSMIRYTASGGCFISSLPKVSLPPGNRAGSPLINGMLQPNGQMR